MPSITTQRIGSAVASGAAPAQPSHHRHDGIVATPQQIAMARAASDKVTLTAVPDRKRDTRLHQVEAPYAPQRLQKEGREDPQGESSAEISSGPPDTDERTIDVTA